MDDAHLRCTLCDEKYSDDRVPRNLGCGHCLCTLCVEDILSRDRRCPECPIKVYEKQASDLPVNYPLLRLIRTLDSATLLEYREANCNSLTSENSGSIHPAEGPVQVARPGFCEIHNEELSHRCMLCCKTLCKSCWSALHKEPPHGRCRVISINEALVETKSVFMARAGTKFKAAKQMKLNLEKEISSLELSTYQHNTTTDSIRTALEDVEQDFLCLESKLERQNEIASGKLEEIQSVIVLMEETRATVEHANSIQELMEALEVANDVQDSADKHLMQEQHRPSPTLPKFLHQGKYNLQRLLDAGERVYATCEVWGNQRFAQVTKGDGMIFIHALSGGARDPNGVTVTYRSVKQMVCRESPGIFFDVSLAGILKERVHLRLFGTTARSRQTMLLCSGEQGHSYKNTRFYQAEGRGQAIEMLRGGDYEYNNGRGGKSIVSGITSGGVYKTEIMAGLLVGWPADQQWRLGSFDIYLKQAPGMYDNSGHGIVTKGLNVLRSVFRHDPVTDSVIQDCGLIIHL